MSRAKHVLAGVAGGVVGSTAMVIFNREGSDGCEASLGMTIEGDTTAFGVAPRSQGLAMFGQTFEYSVLTRSHLPSGSSSVSGLIASTGHSGSHTPQSMHSSGLIARKFSPS